MANEINRIQMNANMQLGKVGEKPEEKAQQKEDNKPQIEQKQVSAEDTLKFMDAQALAARPVEQPRVLNISKYVTPEQAQRICGFITQFEDAVVEGLAAIEAETGNALSEDAKLNLAVEMFKIQNM